MTTTLDELIREMNDMPRPVKISIAFELLPALDGSLHAVDPDPDASFLNEYAVSLCKRTLVIRDGFVLDTGRCSVCREVSRERQAEFDAVVA